MRRPRQTVDAYALRGIIDGYVFYDRAGRASASLAA